MTILVQVVLILAVAYGALTLVRGGANAKHQAIRRLAAVAFFFFAAISILAPDLVAPAARFPGSLRACSASAAARTWCSTGSWCSS